MKFDKNTILGLLFMLLLAFGFSWYSANEAAKEQEQTQVNATPSPTPEQQTPQSQPAPQPTAAVINEPSGLNTDRYASLATSASQSRFELVSLKNDKISIQISTKGGHLHRATLNEFNKYASDQHIELWDTTNTMMNLNWKNGKGETVQSSELYFEPNATQLDATSQKGEIR
ncbi:MAG: YidC/Oxa1 family insertase periplasmic-domain containing protein, partial [Bacteroidota bacterium]